MPRLEWLPIETAPLDETIFFASDGDRVFLCAFWPVKNPDIADWTICYGWMDGDPWVVYDSDTKKADRAEPTHWMPIPEAPSV